jgi:O-methyltransferase
MLLAGSASDPPSVAAARLLEIIEARFGDGLKAARAARASGPRSDAAALRLAYLDLLKLCLCDLGGTSTLSVARTQQGQVMSRELTGDQLRLRAAGMDWPLQGLTMVGLTRLDDLQSCLESVVRDDVTGDVIEAGSWRGGAAVLMRATLDSLGDHARAVWVADSFQGFPQAAGGGDYDLSVDLASCDFLAVPLDEVKQTFARFGLEDGVSFVPGFFQDTLPSLAGRRWSIVRLDGDTYDATLLALESLYPNLSAGGYVIVDDYLSLDQCREAVDDFRRRHGITEPIDEVDWNSVRWRRQGDGPLTTGSAADERPSSVTEAAARPVQRAPRARVPAIEEVELAEETAGLRARLAAAEAEVDRLSGSPWQGPKAWLRRGLSQSRSTR